MDEVTDIVRKKGSKKGSVSVSPRDKGQNKRKLGDPSIGNPVNAPLSLTEFPRYEFSPEKSQSSLCEVKLEAGLDQPKEGPETEASDPFDWEDDPLACQLEKILLSNLQEVFQNAIEKLVELGYSEEVAEKVVSRGGLYFEGKDPTMNIVKDTLYFLEQGKDTSASRDNKFDDVQQLVEYTMLEIVGVLREVRPSLSAVEAMWLLLICDLNVPQAIALEGDPFSGFGCKDVSGESSSSSSIPQFKSEAQSSGTTLANPKEPNFQKPSLLNAQNPLPKTVKFGSFPNLPNPKDLASERVTPEKESTVSLSFTVEKSFGTTEECVQPTEQSCTCEEKSGAGRKGRTKKELAALRHKCIHMDKSNKTYGSKGSYRPGKHSSFGGFVLEKKLKPPSELAGVQMKNVVSKRGTEVGAEVPLADGSLPVSKTLSTLPATENAPTSTSPTAAMKSNPKAQVNTSKAPQIPDYYAGIPYDKSLGKYVPQDEKDELVLKLVRRLQELQDELQCWTEWANQKVMQAARRLGKDQAELKALRLEKEEAEEKKKEKKILEENTTKRLSEMENALGNATAEVEIADSTLRRLEVQNSVLKEELEAAKLRASESAANYQETVEREQTTMKKVQSWEGQKAALQEELGTKKEMVDELQKESGKAKNLYNKTEARWKQERMEKENLLAQAASIRQERERLEAQATAEEEMIKQKAEGEVQKYKEEIKKLEQKLSQMKMEADSSAIAALRSGTEASSSSTGSSGVQAMQRNQNPQGLKQERECAMCLSEEKTVIFLPCAHQLLCAKCNELHEKKGMIDCPACRAPIMLRFNARFAHP
ncbi:putative E3 ubiquitin-protein ligase RF298 [Castanea sativa]|uniref:putative E3 ubiquitin-protein ligase RF298 n=1 Tax=Castanea sativa TaxID=21020 RepID=UPI003F64F915